MPIFAHPRFGPLKKPVFCLRSKFLGMLPTCFFVFFYIDFVFFFMIFAYFPIYLSNFLLAQTQIGRFRECKLLKLLKFNHLIKFENPLRYVKLLPLQGVLLEIQNNPGRCPGLWASAPSGRAAYMSFLAFRALLLIWASWPLGRCCLYGFLGL